MIYCFSLVLFLCQKINQHLTGKWRKVDNICICPTFCTPCLAKFYYFIHRQLLHRTKRACLKFSEYYSMLPNLIGNTENNMHLENPLCKKPIEPYIFLPSEAEIMETTFRSRFRHHFYHNRQVSTTYLFEIISHRLTQERNENHLYMRHSL